MKKLLLATLCALSFQFTVAKPYVSHNLPHSVLKSNHFDFDTANQIIENLEEHAGDYPVQFDQDAHRELAKKEVLQLRTMFEALLNEKIITPKHNAYLSTVLTTARLGWISHNLDLQDGAKIADKYYNLAIQHAPANQKAFVQFLYGNFLSASAQTKRAVTVLEQALKGGYREANKTLGLSYLLLGDKKKSIATFETYLKDFPKDKETAIILDAIKKGDFNVEYK